MEKDLDIKTAYPRLIKEISQKQSTCAFKKYYWCICMHCWGRVKTSKIRKQRWHLNKSLYAGGWFLQKSALTGIWPKPCQVRPTTRCWTAGGLAISQVPSKQCSESDVMFLLKNEVIRGACPFVPCWSFPLILGKSEQLKNVILPRE